MDPSPQSSSSAPGSPAVGSDVAGSGATQATRARPLLAGRGVRVVLVVLVILVLGATGIFAVPHFFCSYFQSARQGLSCDVPLPAQATFVRQGDDPGSPPDISTHFWSYTVPATTVRAVRNLYVGQLPGNGWGCLKPNDTQTPSLGLFMATVTAFNGNRAVGVITQYANQPQSFEPTGDVQLTIELSTFTASHPC